jgi:hypothetical protein
MKLSTETKAILKNYASINSNLLIKAGGTLSTISTAKNIMSDASVVEEFPVQFGIYDVNEFLGALSLFSDPELEFNEKFVHIKEGKNSIKYYSAEENVLTFPTKEIKFPEPEIEFHLPASQIDVIHKTASVLKVADISFVGDGSTITLVIGNKKLSSANSYSTEIGETDKTFTVNLKVELLKLISGDYNVSISSKKISKFQHTTRPVNYFLAVESDSQF